jgi:translation initiation factor 2 beta subunit (eIF-2beta)/eIF-5
MRDFPDIQRFIDKDGRLTLEGMAWLRELVAKINEYETRIADLEA